MNELSEGWVKDKLGNLVDISIGKTPKRSEPRYWQNGIHKWATIASMDFGKELTETAEHITDDALRETKPRKVPKDTLIFSFKLTIGKMAFAGCDLYTNEAIAAFTPTNGRIDKKFLFYALQVADLTINAGDAAKGTTLNTKTMPLIEIAFPENINEQRRIVARIVELTRRAEEARRLRQEAVEKVSTVMHAVIQSILGNRVDFVQTPIGNICSMKTGKTPPTKQIEYFDGDVLFVCPSDLGKSLKISKSERHLTKKAVADGKANLFKTGTVLLVGIGSTVGKVGIAECDLCTNQQITGIVFNDSVSPEYAVWYLSTQRDVIRNAAGGGGVAIINQQGISQLVIWHPNSIDAQRAIVRKLDALQEKLDELTAEQNSVDEELAAFQSALLAKAFRGEL